MTTGEKVLVYRIRRKFSQPDMAAVIGITSQAYGYKERGESEFKISELVKVADKLGVDISELIGDEEEQAAG